MLRLIGFFVGVLLLLGVLRGLPIVGGIFRIPLLGFWITAILLSAFLSRGAVWLLDRRKLQSSIRALGAVDTPHNQAKLGTLLVFHRRFAEGLASLERAIESAEDGDTRADWHYRKGLALFGLRRKDEARAAFERAVAIDEEIGYGDGLLRLAETALDTEDAEASLEALARFERAYGPAPESAFRRGAALLAQERADEARAAFGEVQGLAESSTAYQRKTARSWAVRARLAAWRA